MKKNILLLLFVLIVNIISAQNKDTKSADKLFDRYEFVKAIPQYLKLTEKADVDSYVYKRLGECYYYTYNTVEAENWYAKAFQSGEKQDAESYYRYAHILKTNKKYNESDEQMSIFSSMKPTDRRAVAFTKNPNYLSKLTAIDEKFEVEKMAINSSDKSDFGALLSGNTLYFASSRNVKNAIYGWKKEPYLDIYQSNYNEDGTFGTPELVSELKSKYHEGPVSVSKDGNTIYFSSESFKNNSFVKDKIRKLKLGQVYLFKAVKINGKWANIEPLPFNSNEYSTSNPAIDKEGKFLYFTSNRPGSVGGLDIWKVAINSDGTYGTPENLGDKINTEGDESFPFVSDENILYFASDGLIGFGGFDIFSADLNTNSEPVNLGQPVNSEKDDFAFTFNNEKSIGFLSSNRLGNDNIFSSVPAKIAKITTIVSSTKDKSLLSGAKVVVMDESNVPLESKMTNASGEATFSVAKNKSYKMEVYKDGYVLKTLTSEKVKGGSEIVINVELDPIDVVVNEGEIILNPIYFEFDKDVITSEGMSELDKLVYMMQNNANLKINVKSHTDSRGTEKYNENLSERRANSTVQYVISKGISSDRISGKGFGESELKVICPKTCTEHEHSLNRRSEFIIEKK